MYRDGETDGRKSISSVLTMFWMLSIGYFVSSLQTILRENIYYHHFTNEEIEEQGVEVTFLKPDSK